MSQRIVTFFHQVRAMTEPWPSARSRYGILVLMRSALCAVLFAFIASSLFACGESAVVRAEKNRWGGARACLPCHHYRLPTARRHNYHCETCPGSQADTM